MRLAPPILITTFILVSVGHAFAQQTAQPEHRGVNRPSSQITSYHAKRLNGGNPIIDFSTFAALGVPDEGRNVAGPSVIRIPDWIKPEDRADPSAIYYLYFSHHRGKYIRLAWSVTISGPWSLYHTGTQHLSGQRGVLDLGDAPIQLQNKIRIPNNHLGSPDAHVDDRHQQIVLYFHSGSKIEVDGVPEAQQKSFAATSVNGLNFRNRIEPVILGLNYLRAFEYAERAWGIGNGGHIMGGRDARQSRTPPEGWDFSDNLWPLVNNDLQKDIDAAGMGPRKILRVRHAGIRLIRDSVDGDTLEVFYSRRGTDRSHGVLKPERILMSRIQIAADVPAEQWNSEWPPEEILTSEMDWEGAHLPIRPSRSDIATGRSHSLQDPDIFVDQDNRVYLFYIGGGEHAMGVAELIRPD
jgi:hypothetical protein